MEMTSALLAICEGNPPVGLKEIQRSLHKEKLFALLAFCEGKPLVSSRFPLKKDQ